MQMWKSLYITHFLGASILGIHISREVNGEAQLWEEQLQTVVKDERKMFLPANPNTELIILKHTTNSKLLF